MTDVLDAAQTRYLDEFRKLREEFSRFMFSYKFGMEEVATKVGILQQEFQHLQQYNPIEHVSSRLKSPESVLDKIARSGLGSLTAAERAKLEKRRDTLRKKNPGV